MPRKKNAGIHVMEIVLKDTGQNISTKMIHHGLQEWAKFQFNQCKSQLETTKWIFQ